MPSYKGFFKPQNPQKYKGDANNIVYRSRWECVLMGYLDKHPDVIQWNSEEIRIPYISPIDNRRHTYYPDFYVKKINASDRRVEECLIEVKPKSQTKPPVVMESGKKPTKSYINQVKTWGINSAKWAAARNYCESRNWSFVIMTEDHLGLTF